MVAILLSLPGTAPLVIENDTAAALVEGIHTFLDRETTQSARRRERFWQRDYASAEAYSRSLAANRERSQKIIGAGYARLPAPEMQLDVTTSTPAQVAQGIGYKVFAVRWPVLKGVTAEGMLLEPDGPPLARMVATPSADWSPEMLADLALSDLLVDLGASERRLRLKAPIKSKSFLVPFHDCFAFNNDQDLPLIFPESRQRHQEKSISPIELRPFDTSVENSELLVIARISVA